MPARYTPLPSAVMLLKHRISRGTFIFDPALVLDDTSDPELFSLSSGSLRAFGREFVPDAFDEIRDPEPLGDALRQYDAWKAQNPALLQERQRIAGERRLLAEAQRRLDEERRRLEEEQRREAERQRAAEARELAIERHRDYLARLEKPYSGVRALTPSGHRVTHCYECRSGLDNRINAECAACGWIICWYCGACGAGYTLRAVPGH